MIFWDFHELQRWFCKKIKYRHNKFDKVLPYQWDKIPYDRKAIINQVCVITKATAYLEIGCFKNEVYDIVNVEKKIGVDPEQGGTHRMTSDNFFEQNNAKFDVIFIDGLHHYEQVHNDVINSLNALKNGGIIVLDDMIPIDWKEEHVPRINHSWTGDVWKCAFEIDATKGLDFKILLCGNGTGIIKPKPNHDKLVSLSAELGNKRYAYFYENYKKLPLIEAEKGIEWMQI